MNSVHAVHNQWASLGQLQGLNMRIAAISKDKDKDNSGTNALNTEGLGIDAVTFSTELKRAHMLNMDSNNILKNKDSNGDNALNVEELGVDEEIFNIIDKNGDGQADRAELRLAYRDRMVNMMNDHLIANKDTNEDNVLSVEELGVDEEIFNSIDKNGDGQVVRAELNMAHKNKMVNEMRPHLIANKDANEDNVLSAEELGVDEEIFNSIDKNGDGQADYRELAISHKQRQLIASYQSQITNETDANIDTTA